MRSVSSKCFFLENHLFTIIGLKFQEKCGFVPRIIFSNNFESVSLSMEDFEMIFTSRWREILHWFASEGTFTFPFVKNFELFISDSPKSIIVRSLETHQCIKLDEMQFRRILKILPCIINHYRKTLENVDLTNFSFSSLIVEVGEIIKRRFSKIPSDKEFSIILKSLEKTELITEINRIYHDVCMKAAKKYLETQSVLSAQLI